MRVRRDQPAHYFSSPEHVFNKMYRSRIWEGDALAGPSPIDYQKYASEKRRSEQTFIERILDKDPQRKIRPISRLEAKLLVWKLVAKSMYQDVVQEISSAYENLRKRD